MPEDGDAPGPTGTERIASYVERAARIALTSSSWKEDVLLLNYARRRGNHSGVAAESRIGPDSWGIHPARTGSSQASP